MMFLCLRKKPKVGETASKMSFRTFREPRCVDRRKCYSNVVDDGYRWCKYGQKAIKGNPHPRYGNPISAIIYFLHNLRNIVSERHRFLHGENFGVVIHLYIRIDVFAV